ncbi:MAG: MinD/ParA family protein [Armatimonadetes bacterium]|nr:MinD/ParA family protein [Armatimonadota bacterium]
MKTIAVTSGKGGVGKTSLSTNLGIALTRLGERTVVFDADLALANVEVLLGVRAERTLQHVVAGESSMSEIVARGPEGLGVIAGGSGIPMLMRSGPKRLGVMFEQVQELAATTDILIFDTSAGLENKVLAFLKNADEVLVVTTPEPASITDSYATIKTLFRQKPDAVVKVVVNQARDGHEANEVFGVLSRITQDFLKKELEFAGFVRQDEAVSRSARLRKPYMMAEPKSDAAKDTSKLAVSFSSAQPLKLSA